MKKITDHELFVGIVDNVKKSFEEFHAVNPHVADLYVHFARQMKQNGRRRYGANAITERIRWHVDLELNSEEEFAISSKYASCYARYLAIMHPEEFGNFFNFRKCNKAERYENEAE